jgi:asparagine synthase (glutamine-hydrolysing)
MAQSSSQPVKSFTVVFRGKGLEFYNEQQAAKRVSGRFGTEHRELDVEVPNPMAMLDLVEHFDQPFGNPTFYLMYLISQHTRPEATVALCGAGGDELFGGYPRYRAIRLARLLRWMPPPAVAIARWMLSLPGDDYRTMRLRRARQFFEGLDGDLARQFVKWTYFMDEKTKSSVLARDAALNGETLRSERVVARHLAERGVDGSADSALLVDLQTFLPDNILEYTDKMSMAVSLEVRVPLLDHRVVKLVTSMPFVWKVRGSSTKVILKEACADLLPEGHLTAPKKGFNVPLAMWMRDHLDKYFVAQMNQSEVEKQGVFRWEGIQQLRDEHAAGRRDNAHELFSLIMFDLWYRKYILQTEPLGFQRLASHGAGRR